MPLSNVVKNINKYVFQIQIFKGYNELINAGTGFYARWSQGSNATRAVNASFGVW
jgi:hypothetical protein